MIVCPNGSGRSGRFVLICETVRKKRDNVEMKSPAGGVIMVASRIEQTAVVRKRGRFVVGAKSARRSKVRSVSGLPLVALSVRLT